MFVDATKVKIKLIQDGKNRLIEVTNHV